MSIEFSMTAQVVTRAAEMRKAIVQAQQTGKTVGLVPTMGALHGGHLSLVDASLAECDRTVVTIFVNPTQFSPGDDFDHYPRTMEQDLAQLRERGCWTVFAPTVEEMYPAGHETIVDVGSIRIPLEGVARPRHFFGVATVVLKLLNMVPADRAYFGQKDYQQTLVVRKLASDLNVPTEICVCPIVRESDGLAMSSRNTYLSSKGRCQALALSHSLELAKEMHAMGEMDAARLRAKMLEHIQAVGGIEVEYIAFVTSGTVDEVQRIEGPTVIVLAGRVENIRLLDNCQIGV
jgi:pantoate--beta-alanine ligase